jgi:thermitase
MAWSETPNGVDPWQTWARILDPIKECATLPEPDECCVSPCGPPWIVEKDCLLWYEDRFVRFPLRREKQTAELALAAVLREYIEFRITYQHELCLVGKQQGPLLYTVTLLPGEKSKLYHSDRYRRITSQEQRFSVQTTFTQFLSTVHESRVTDKLDALSEALSTSKSGSSGSSGGGFFGGLFGFGGSSSDSSQSSVTDHNLVQVGRVSSAFFQSVSQASSLTRAERSLVVSAYEDKESLDVTVREISNENSCRAVTYFVRQVVDAYLLSTVVYDISYRIIAPGVPSLWHSVNDLGWLPSVIAAEIEALLKLLPKVGDATDEQKPFTLPTDGAVYDAELAHCGSCEPEREALLLIAIEKAKYESRKLGIEAELLETEIERRRALIAKGDLGPFEPALATRPPSA